MKVGETLLIIVMVGTLSRAAKLLKTPRIYNALITSDEKLSPSQAYPAISPVIQGIQYPVPGYVAAPGIYHPFIPVPTYNGAATATAGRSFSYAVKQDYFSYNYFENDAMYGPKLPIPVIPDPNQPVLFGSGAGPQPLPKEQQLPYPSSESRADTQKTSFKYDDEQGANNDDANENGNGYAVDSSAAAVPKHSHPQRGGHGGPRKYNGVPQKHPAYADPYHQRNYDTDTSNSAEDSTESAADEETDNGGGYLPAPGLPFVKNHQPNDPSVFDIPPEPLPGQSKDNKKKTNQYPPPPPLGLFL